MIEESFYDIEKVIYDSDIFTNNFRIGEYYIVVVQPYNSYDRYITLINSKNIYNKYKLLAVIERDVTKKLGFENYSYCDLMLNCSFVCGCQLLIELQNKIKNIYIF